MIISQDPLLAIFLLVLGLFIASVAWKFRQNILHERFELKDEQMAKLTKDLEQAKNSKQQLDEQIESLKREPKSEGSANTFTESISAPEPQFGCPLQLIPDLPLSWWHIPVWLKVASGSRITSYEHCRASLIFLERGPFPDRSLLDLRCQSDKKEGSKEFLLRVGEEPKQLPIVARTEMAPPESPYPASFTDEGYLLHGVMQKVEPGTYRFRITIRYETRTWESGVYALRVPDGKISKGQCVLSKEPDLI